MSERELSDFDDDLDSEPREDHRQTRLRVRLLEIDGDASPPSRHQPPITARERAALRRYLDTLDQIDRGSASAEDELPVDWARLKGIIVLSRAPMVRQTKDEILYRTVERDLGLPYVVGGGMVVCRTHLLELRAFSFRGAPLRVRALGVRERSTYIPPTCAMCDATISHGNVCHNDDCAAPLHPQWPAVYCTNECALEDR
jgi:hypothetical protein